MGAPDRRGTGGVTHQQAELDRLGGELERHGKLDLLLLLLAAAAMARARYWSSFDGRIRINRANGRRQDRIAIERLTALLDERDG